MQCALINRKVSVSKCLEGLVAVLEFQRSSLGVSGCSKAFPKRDTAWLLHDGEVSSLLLPRGLGLLSGTTHLERNRVWFSHDTVCLSLSDSLHGVLELNDVNTIIHVLMLEGNTLDSLLGLIMLDGFPS